LKDKSINIKVFRGVDGENPCVVSIKPQISTITELIVLIENELDMPSGSIYLYINGKRAEIFRRVAEYEMLLNPDSANVLLKLFLRGGAKRGRIEKSAARTSKVVKTKELKEEIGTHLLRLNIGILAPVVGQVVRLLAEISQQMVNHEGEIISMMTAPLSIAKLQQMLEITSTSNGMDTRMNSLCDILFVNGFEIIDDLKHQLTSGDKAMRSTIHLCMLQQFGNDETGAISWTSFSKVIVKAMSDKVLAAAAANAAGAAGLGAWFHRLGHHFSLL